MTKCLVTKLNGTVSNDNIVKVGEMRIGVPKVDNPTDGSQCIRLSFNQLTTLKIIGNGHFTDKTLTEDYGKEIQSNDSRIQNGDFYVSNSEYVEVSISNKYAINHFALNFRSTGTNKFKFSLDDLKYSTALGYLTASNTGVTGDLSSLSNLTALTNIILSGTGVTGDFSFYANKPKMKYVSINIKMTGDVSNLKNCSELIQFSCGTNSVLSGDLSQLPAKFKHFNMTGEGVSGLTWSTRPSSSSIVGMILPQWAPSNLDKVLQDLSACQAIQTSSDPVYYKRISLGGKRTAASDDAVATLQSKGFSVEVAK